MNASLVGVVVVSIVSVVGAVCAVDVEGKASPVQEMFKTTSAKKYYFVYYNIDFISLRCITIQF